jgi:hypothetical protein
MEGPALRNAIYQHFAATCEAPARPLLEEWCSGPATADANLRALHDTHAIVLAADGSIRMALPFSAIPTAYRVSAADGRSWRANCAWDSLAIPAAIGVAARIEALWMDSGETVRLSVAGGRLSHTDGFVHFAIPAAHWWDDIVAT